MPKRLPNPLDHLRPNEIRDWLFIADIMYCKQLNEKYIIEGQNRIDACHYLAAREQLARTWTKTHYKWQYSQEAIAQKLGRTPGLVSMVINQSETSTKIAQHIVDIVNLNWGVVPQGDFNQLLKRNLSRNGKRFCKRLYFWHLRDSTIIYNL